MSEEGSCDIFSFLHKYTSGPHHCRLALPPVPGCSWRGQESAALGSTSASAQGAGVKSLTQKGLKCAWIQRAPLPRRGDSGDSHPGLKSGLALVHASRWEEIRDAEIQGMPPRLEKREEITQPSHRAGFLGWRNARRTPGGACPGKTGETAAGREEPGRGTRGPRGRRSARWGRWCSGVCADTANPASRAHSAAEPREYEGKKENKYTDQAPRCAQRSGVNLATPRTQRPCWDLSPRRRFGSDLASAPPHPGLSKSLYVGTEQRRSAGCSLQS